MKNQFATLLSLGLLASITSLNEGSAQLIGSGFSEPRFLVGAPTTLRNTSRINAVRDRVVVGALGVIQEGSLSTQDYELECQGNTITAITMGANRRLQNVGSGSRELRMERDSIRPDSIIVRGLDTPLVVRYREVRLRDQISAEEFMSSSGCREFKPGLSERTGSTASGQYLLCYDAWTGLLETQPDLTRRLESLHRSRITERCTSHHHPADRRSCFAREWPERTYSCDYFRGTEQAKCLETLRNHYRQVASNQVINTTPEFSLCLDESCQRIQRLTRLEDLAQAVSASHIQTQAARILQHEAGRHQEVAAEPVHQRYRDFLIRTGIPASASDNLCRENTCQLPVNYESLVNNNEDKIGSVRLAHSEVNQWLRYLQLSRRNLRQVSAQEAEDLAKQNFGAELNYIFSRNVVFPALQACQNSESCRNSVMNDRHRAVCPGTRAPSNPQDTQRTAY